MPNDLPAPGLLLWADQSVTEFLRLAALAEETGYSELWYTDLRFERDVYANLALAAQQTSHILLGPGVSDPYTRHPALLAAAVATLDEISHGRAQVGLGIGSNLGQVGMVQDRPVRALREAIEIIRLVLAGGPVQYDGEIFKVRGGKLGYKPARTAIPVFVASHSHQTLKLSGKLADGVLLANMGRREAIESAISIVHEGEREAGRPSGSVAIHLRLEACISDDEQSALNAMRRRLATRLVNTYPKWDHLEELGIEATDAMREAAAARNADVVSSNLSDADVRSSTLAGSVEQVTAHLSSVLTPEVTKVTIRPLAYAGQNLDFIITKFITEVWPNVRIAAPAEESRS